MTRIILGVFVAFALIAVSGEAWGDSIAPTSYDMLNGGNEGYGYFDDAYSGTGSITTGYAPLSGGLGELTDGVIPTVSWNFTVSAHNQPEPYVGWSYRDVEITFHFGGTVQIDSVTVWADHASYGDVGLPQSAVIEMGGATSTCAIAAPSTYGPRALVFDGLDLTGTSLTLTLGNSPPYRNRWIMVSEVIFAGTSSVVPEPTTLALLGLGLGAAGLAWRRKSGSR